ncbi:MAG: RNase P subunit p30 family protein [Nanoarchaeota archaeon]
MKYTLIQEKDFNKIKKKIKESKEDKIVFLSDSDDLNRQVLEKAEIDLLLLNQQGRKDFMKQRNSGLNHVMTKIAKERGIFIGINLDEIIEANKIEKPRILARIKQNIKLCNKNKVNMKFVFFKKKNKRNIDNLKSLGLVLGMPTWMTKNLELIELNKEFKK